METVGVEVWSVSWNVLQRSIWVALRGLIRQGFDIGQGGSHGAKNNASKTTENCGYTIDIIILF